VEVRDGVPTLLGTLVTEGPTTMYGAFGPTASLGSMTPVQQVDGATSFALPVTAPGPARRFRLVADNARGHYESPLLVVAPRPRVTVTGRRVAARTLLVSATIRGLARVQVRSISLLVSRGGGPSRGVPGAVALRARPGLVLEVSRRLALRAGTPARVVVRVRTTTGAVADGALRVRG
jgi:hypothetical protein